MCFHTMLYQGIHAWLGTQAVVDSTAATITDVPLYVSLLKKDSILDLGMVGT